MKNIISGSFRAMIAQARDHDLVSRDVFGKLKWPQAEPPEPDPLTAAERTRIIDWFKPSSPVVPDDCMTARARRRA